MKKMLVSIAVLASMILPTAASAVTPGYHFWKIRIYNRTGDMSLKLDYTSPQGRKVMCFRINKGYRDWFTYDMARNDTYATATMYSNLGCTPSFEVKSVGGRVPKENGDENYWMYLYP